MNSLSAIAACIPNDRTRVYRSLDVVRYRRARVPAGTLANNDSMWTGSCKGAVEQADHLCGRRRQPMSANDISIVSCVWTLTVNMAGVSEDKVQDKIALKRRHHGPQRRCQAVKLFLSVVRTIHKESRAIASPMTCWARRVTQMYQTETRRNIINFDTCFIICWGPSKKERPFFHAMRRFRYALLAPYLTDHSSLKQTVRLITRLSSSHNNTFWYPF